MYMGLSIGLNDFGGPMRKSAFTLVELLVVISTISLMMAILMPALSRARQQGKSVMCLSNLRQMDIASQSYVNDNDGYYPSAYVNDPDPLDAILVYVCWDFTHKKDWTTLEEKNEPGLLWEGQTIDKIQQCPSFKGAANSKDLYTGYNYNTSYIGHGSLETIKLPAKASEVKSPVNCAIFGDGEYVDGANKFMRAPWPDCWDEFPFRAAGTQGYRHEARTNVAWCDGHVSSQKELYTDTLPEQKGQLDTYNATAKNKVGFLSPDNSAYDLK